MDDRCGAASDADSVRSLIAEAPIVAFTLDLDGIFTAVEGGGLAAVGMDIRQALGQSVFTVFPPEEEVAINCRRALRGEQFTVVVHTGDRAFETRYSPIFGESGELRGTVGVSLEVTDRESAVSELRAREERYRAFIEHAHDSIIEIDPEARILYASPRFGEMTGYSAEHIVGRMGTDFIHPDDLAMVNELRIHAMETETEVELIFRFRHQDSSWRWLEVGGRPFRTSNGELRAVLILRDVTQRIRMEQGRLGQVELETRIGELSRRLMMVDSRDLEQSIQQELQAAGAMAGAERCYLVLSVAKGETPRTFEWAEPGVGGRREFYSSESPRNHAWATAKLIAGEVIHLPDIESLPDEAAAMLDELRAIGVRSQLLIPVLDGSRLVAVMGLRCVRAAKEWSPYEIHVLRLVAGLFTSALHRRGAEAALHASEERFRAMAENAQDAIMEIGSDGSVLYVNASCEALLGYSFDELVAMPPFEPVHPDDRERLANAHEFSSGAPGAAGTTLYRSRHRDGSDRWLEASGRGFKDIEGEFRMVAVIRDVTEREHNQRGLERQLLLEKEIAILSQRFLALSGSEVDDRIREGVAAVGKLAEVDRCWFVPTSVEGQRAEVVYTWNCPGDLARVPDLERLEYGTSPASKQVSQVIQIPRVDELPAEVGRARSALQHRATHSFLGIPLVSDLGVVGSMGFETLHEERCWDDEMIRLLRLAGEIFVSALNRKRAEVALANSQAQLVQSQKMEAVGTLAGGIAHDFNNQLAVILGNARHLLGRIGSDFELRDSLGDLERAAEHCAELTKSLLAFSRQTPAKPRSIDLSQALRDVKKLMDPMISNTISIEVDAAQDLEWVQADPTQLQQVLVNLAVNSRDAMPEGGELLIRARNRVLDGERAEILVLPPGEYVEISVADSGAGMDDRTQSRIFDPFFTTKPPGKGTGLGLATAYGIVRECGGAIEVESVVGSGSTFRVLLPRSFSGLGETASVESVEQMDVSETVLLVEDDDSIRRIVERMLVRQGYDVLEATDGIDALRISQCHTGVIDLVVTDMVMPNMTGEELAARLLLSRPGVCVLFISGYSERDPSIPKSRLLAKPFREQGLLDVVRELLDERSASDADSP
jgi:two-component system cell cycle sensor histidine kinase/response regulator CckA